MEFEPVIGLEVHVQLNTASKIFCGCPTGFGAEPNTRTCPVCMGLPGALPVLNSEALDKGIRAGLALDADIAAESRFDRKNYFYPDLPKGYQISQFDLPLCRDGHVDITTGQGARRIGITRLHLEEDAGKSIHSDDPGNDVSYVDFNRAGVPLAEIVSEPELRSGEEAYRYLQKLRSIMKYIGVSDVNMEEGSLRCDVNISIRRAGSEAFGQKVEIKNLNSFKAVRSAIDYECRRQESLVATGAQDRIVQETRFWDADRGETCGMRSKEHAHDYRYFPDPDLPPVRISRQTVEALRTSLPELPDARLRRFVAEYRIPAYDAGVLTAERGLADYFEGTVAAGAQPKKASNWIMGELLAKLGSPEMIGTFPVAPAMLAKLLSLVDDGTISGTIAKTVFDEMIADGGDPAGIVAAQGLVQVTDTARIEALVERVLAANPESVAAFRNGREKAAGFLVGQVMRESHGKAHPALVNELVLKKLKG